MAKKLDPFAQPDKLGSELTVRAGIDETGVSLKAKSRAITALDRLIGSALDIPGIWLERRSERARLIAATEQEAIKIDAKAFLSDKEKNLDGKSAPAWMKDLSIHARNRSEVASHFIENLENQDRVDEKVEGSADFDMTDWLNAFIHRAEMASSENMQAILGKILAGEITSPGSFSVSTLRIITELDQKSAVLFQSLCLQRFNERHILKRDSDLTGDRMYELYDLEERGLLKEVGGALNYTLQKQEDGFYYFNDESDVLRFVIEPKGEYIPVSNVLGMFLLTNAGYQLARLLPHDRNGALDAIAQMFATRPAVKEIQLFKVDGRKLMPVREILLRRE